jgi:hypothetical protein
MSTSHPTLNLLETVGLQQKTILNQLDSIFPPVNPTPEMTTEQIMYKAGQRSVVEWIKNQSEE